MIRVHANLRGIIRLSGTTQAGQSTPGLASLTRAAAVHWRESNTEKCTERRDTRVVFLTTVSAAGCYIIFRLMPESSES